MTSRARIGCVVLVSTALMAMTACSSDNNDAAPTTVPPTAPGTTMAPTTTAAPPVDIVATALTAGVFTTLAGLVVDAGLVDTLRSPGPFTVFAPTDAAFAKVPTATLRAVQADPKLLGTVLTYHVVAGALKLEDLKKLAASGGKLMTVAKIELTITMDGDKVLVDGHPIAAGDVPASNGVIHVMGDVLVPKS